MTEEKEIMKAGNIVKHKLTGEKMLVLEDDPLAGTTSVPKVRLRTMDLKEIYLDEAEVVVIEE